MAVTGRTLILLHIKLIGKKQKNSAVAPSVTIRALGTRLAHSLEVVPCGLVAPSRSVLDI